MAIEIKFKNIQNIIWANPNKSVVKCSLTIDENGIIKTIDDYYIEKDVGPQWVIDAFESIDSSLVSAYDSSVCHMESVFISIPLDSKIRTERDTLLIQLDAIVMNPLRWNGLTQAEQDELSTYRQALLDVPQQDGFPDTVEWPTKPSFI